MTHFLEKKDPWGNGAGLWVLVVMALALPPTLWSLTNIELDNDIRKWVPEDEPNARTLAWYHDYFPPQETALISWEGSTLNDPRVGWLTDRLQGVEDEDGVFHNGCPYVKRVVTPQSLLRQIEEDDVLHGDALARLQGVLIGTGPLKLRFSEIGQARRKSTLKTLSDRLRDELGIEVEFLDPASDWVPPVSIDEYAIAERIIEQEERDRFPDLPEHHVQIRWEGLQRRGELTNRVITIAESLMTSGPGESRALIEEAFFAPGSPITVAVVLNEHGEAEKRDAISEIRRIAGELGIDEDIVHLGGRPVAGAALSASIRNAAWNREASAGDLPGRSIILFSGLVGIVLAFVMLRSAILAGLVLFVSYFTVLATTALVPATGGSMNMVLVVMPTLLLVLTMSGAIHVASYWRFAATLDVKQAPITAAKLATRPCFLAGLTTAFGLLSLTASDLKPVFDFGLYAAIGCFVGLGAILFGLPSLLQFAPERIAKPTARFPEFWPKMSASISRHRTSVTAACLVLFAACSAGLFQYQTETKVIRYFPDESQIVRDYNWMEENIGGIVPVDIVVRFAESDRAPADDGLLFAQRREIVRRVQQKIVEKNPDVTGSLSLATFLPAESDEEIQRRASNPFLRRLDIQAEQQVWNNDSARMFVKVAEQAADLESPGDSELCEAGDELWRISAQVNIMTDVDYSVLMTDVNRIVQEETRVVAGANHAVTGMVPLFLETQKQILISLIESFLIAFVVIGALISWVLRSIRAGLVTMLPNVLPISTVFGAISWCGIPIDIGTMITASVALGIAVDGTLHLLTWFREGVRRGRTRRLAVSEALGHCGPALFQTSVVVTAGLLVVVPAELNLISRFGWMMSAMIGTALFADLIFLPALLCGGLGRLIMTIDGKTDDTTSPPFQPTVDETAQGPGEQSLNPHPEPARTGPPRPHALDQVEGQESPANEDATGSQS